MRIRPYLECKDFEAIKNWITDERTHAFWCAGHTDFPLEKEDFSTLLKEIAEMFGDAPYVATTDEGEVVGFFCCPKRTNFQTALSFMFYSNSHKWLFDV